MIFLTSNLAFSQGQLQQKLNQYKDSLPNYGIVALVDNGQKLDSASVGWASRNNEITVANRFCIGSVTKMFTATVILMLHEDGLLSLTDSIGQYLPKHAFIDSSITIKQLLSHTSGLKDIVDAKLANRAFLDPYFDYSNAYLLRLIDSVEFEKGAKYQYSNTNYFLLKMIAEKVTDKPFESILLERIINPLGLKNTFPYYAKSTPNMAHPILGSQDLHSYPKRGDNQISVGLGNIVCTATDLNTFIRALFIEKRLLKDNTLAEMCAFAELGKTKVGLGVFAEEFGGKPFIGHTGRTISYISYAFVNIETSTSWVLLCNNVNDHYIDDLAEKLFE
ncbi:MAG: beta-lactamase family protein [Bacteroidetes bacterium]|nr:beta-lactamase family protein [Bacteroidota bacterium]